MTVTVGWVYHDGFLRHDTGPFHPEQPARLLAVCLALDRAGLLSRLRPIEFTAAEQADLCLVHDPIYVDLLRVACREGLDFIGSPDTPICRHSYDVAALAVGGVLAACDAVMQAAVDRAFCAVRPPGHHALRDQAMGFCLMNNVAIAAEHLVHRHGLQRVAIVDFDVHHGNGTQQAFDERDDVLYISLHERSGTLPFPGTGQAAERGRGAGRGYTLNIPVVAGSDESAYRQAMGRDVLPALERFSPQLILVSAGFDAAADESIAHINLQPASFGWITDQLVQVAERCCQGRLISVLEGGYETTVLARSAVAHVAALLGQ